jgi:predicted AlkP superfamily pyrophosphatase or phosphodiesterase
MALAELNSRDEVLKLSPYGNSLVLEFARAAVIKENLGNDAIPDFLAISLSTPDYMGHAYGPRAMEIEDMYIRLDRDLSRLLTFLDSFVGIGEYMVFLTADHGAADNPDFAQDNKIPGGFLKEEYLLGLLDSALHQIHPSGLDLIEEIEGNQLYLKKEFLKEHGLNYAETCAELSRKISNFPGIYAAYPAEVVRWYGGNEFPLLQLSRGLHPDLSGDVVWVIDSGFMEYRSKGTTHGTPWTYDTHVPLLLYGKGVRKGRTYRETHIRDIAPTLSMLLRIGLPSGATGTPVFEAID